jgi:hypothetical protein
MKAAWASVTSYWTSPAPDHFKRQLFYSRVIGAGCSGLAAFVATEADTKELDKQAAKYLRVTCRGRATWQTTSSGHMQAS